MSHLYLRTHLISISLACGTCSLQKANRSIALVLLKASDAAHSSDLATDSDGSNSSNSSCLLPQPMLLKLLSILRLGILGLLLDLLLQLMTDKGILASALVALLLVDEVIELPLLLGSRCLLLVCLRCW